MRKTRDIWHEKWDYEEDWKEPTPISVNPSIRANFRYKIDNFSFEDMEGKSDAEKIEKLLGHKTSTPKRKPQNKFPQLNVRNMF